MATCPDQPTTQDLSACPFCGRHFQKLGNHLPRCGERGDRDYPPRTPCSWPRSSLVPRLSRALLWSLGTRLAKKTIEKKAKKGGSRQRCPKCHKCFLRLDTHLKRSATCRSLVEAPIASSSAPSHPEPGPDLDICPDLSHIPTVLPGASPGTCTPPPGLTPSSHKTKATLKLPSSKEDWQKANVYLKENVVPRVLQACSVEEKNSILADGIYIYFPLPMALDRQLLGSGKYHPMETMTEL